MMQAQPFKTGFSDRLASLYFGEHALDERVANAEHSTFRRNVVVLSDDENFSCGELFAAIVQYSEMAVVVGVNKPKRAG